MTTYNSYQEAKIANPESEIVTTGPNWKYNHDLKGKFERLDTKGIEPHILEDSAWVKCDPSKYCMTVEKFLVDGCKFVEGDVIISVNGKVAVMGVDGYHCCNFNIKHVDDGKIYILRAEALKPRDNEYAMSVMGKYVKVEDDVSLFSLEDELSNSKLFIKTGNEYLLVMTLRVFCREYQERNLYRRIETEIDERQEFIDKAKELIDASKQVDYSLGAMFDSGCRFTD